MINYEIKAKTVRLVTEDGATEINRDEAIKLAEEQELDLICIAENSGVPIVKIDDYAKYKYNKAKKQKEIEKKNRQKNQESKEVQIGAATAEHDLDIKAFKIDKMLSKNCRIKLVVRYKGRERMSMRSGPEKLEYLASKLTTEYDIVQKPKIEGSNVSMVIQTRR